MGESGSFQGVVQGKSAVGGVAGRNSESGQMLRCSAGGAVSGERATVGIAGRAEPIPFEQLAQLPDAPLRLLSPGGKVLVWQC